MNLKSKPVTIRVIKGEKQGYLENQIYELKARGYRNWDGNISTSLVIFWPSDFIKLIEET